MTPRIVRDRGRGPLTCRFRVAPLTHIDIRRLSEVTRELPRVVRTENGDLVSVAPSEFAEPGLSAQTEVAVHLRAGLDEVQQGVWLWFDVQLSVVVVGVAAM